MNGKRRTSPAPFPCSLPSRIGCAPSMGTDEMDLEASHTSNVVWVVLARFSVGHARVLQTSMGIWRRLQQPSRMVHACMNNSWQHISRRSSPAKKSSAQMQEVYYLILWQARQEYDRGPSHGPYWTHRSRSWFIMSWFRVIDWCRPPREN